MRSSRCTNDPDSSVDEGEISVSSFDVRMQKKRKKMPLSAQHEMKVRNQLINPEFREVKREGSEGARARSSDSDEVARGRSSRRDNYAGKDLDNNDYIKMEEERNNGGTSVSHTCTDSEDERDSPNTPEPAASQRNVNMLQCCRSVAEFERLNKMDEGTYGVVYRAKDKKTGEIVALKKVKMEKEREGFPLTSLQEINILLSFDHPSIVDVKEVVVGSSLDSILLVMENMEHDLKALIETKKQPFSQSEVKCLMIQLLEGVKAPELLLGAKQYSTAIDMWSLGCMMAELLLKEPLFNGKTEFDKIDKRMTADAALSHEWFREVPLPKSKGFMPTFPAHHAQDRHTRRVLKSPDPIEEQRRKELQQREFGTGGLFG
ncbi:hypothetical protein AgCh_035414 [Apium graveolens]